MTTLELQSVVTRLKSERKVAIPNDHPHRQEGARRALNVAVASIGLVITAPLMAAIAVVVKLTSPGPVFYRQQRVGLDIRAAAGGNFRRKVDLGGKPFTILKFRTMRAAKPAEEIQVWASENDPRITRVGAFLRRTRLDELPQLFNVLRGDMNIVGPRPERPSIVLRLREQIDEYPMRQRTKPGITGWAQINGWRGETDTREKILRRTEHDLYYIENWSLLFDLYIIARTPLSMVQGENAF